MDIWIIQAARFADTVLPPHMYGVIKLKIWVVYVLQ